MFHHRQQQTRRQQCQQQNRQQCQQQCHSHNLNRHLDQNSMLVSVKVASELIKTTHTRSIKHNSHGNISATTSKSIANGQALTTMKIHTSLQRKAASVDYAGTSAVCKLNGSITLNMPIRSNPYYYYSIAASQQ